LSYDHDVDVATFLGYNENNWNLTRDLRDLLVTQGRRQDGLFKDWALVETFGFPWLAYQLRLWNFRSRWGLDIFFADWNSTDELFYFGYHAYPSDRYCLLKYPKSAFERICSAEFDGHKMYVPCRPDLVHLAEYGDKWATPSRTYSINNGFCVNSYWLPKEAPHAYQCYGLSKYKDLNVLNMTNYSPEERKSSKLSKQFKKMAAKQFDLCQDLKVYRFLN
jgi:hypothetical protein